MRRRGLLAAAAGALAGTTCARAGDPAAVSGTVVRLGTIPGPQLEILERVRELAAPAGLLLRLDVRPGGRRINADVAQGHLDAAAFQDGVAFTDEVHRTAAPLAVAATTVTLPMALYSRRLRHPAQVREGDAIALPLEPPERARALVLLQNFGLVLLRDDIGLHARLGDVIANPRRLRLQPLPSARLYDTLPSVALAAIDDGAATRAGLEPARDSIGIEDARSPWAGVLAVRRDRASEPWVTGLVAAYRSPPIKRFLLERWRDSVRRPW